MTIVRTMAGINKAEDIGRKDTQIGIADACSSAKPSPSTKLTEASNPDGNIARRGNR